MPRPAHLLALLTLAAPAAALAAAGEPSTALRLWGRLHPVLVHFPIALAFTAGLLELIWCLRRRPADERRGPRAPSPSAVACLLVAAPLGGLAAWSGWTNAGVESHARSAAELISLHRWTAIAAASIIALAAVLALAARRPAAPALRGLYRVALGASVAAVGFASHLGGSLVYGRDYILGLLFAPDPARDTVVPERAAVIPDSPESRFLATIAPILEQRCIKCHGPTLQKGRLRLDSADAAADAILPGAPDASELFLRVSLPADDPDIMPAEGDPLTRAQIEALRDWIAQGAPWPAGTVLRRAGAQDQGAAEPSPQGSVRARDEALERLRARGAIAHPLAAIPDAGVEVSFRQLDRRAGDDDLRLLAGLEPWLESLDLAGSAVTDAGLAPLARFSRVRRLHLERTSIGDAGLDHLGSLLALEYLNLYETRVTDAAIDRLALMPSLRRVYLWRSGVSAGGAEKLRAALPGALVDLGEQNPPGDP